MKSSFLYTPLAYLRYLTKARGSRALHSPFLYQFYSEVIAIQKQYYVFGALDTLRLSLMQNTKRIQVQDFGAGSKRMGNERSIAQIARNSAVSKKEGELLFRITNELCPNTILELGTSLGLSTLYMAKTHKATKVHTFEGCPETAKIAQQNFSAIDAPNIKLHLGNIDETLPAFLTKQTAIDLAYIDANHQYEPTIRYFEQILPHLAPEGVLIFDDIHWSADMNRAWETIKQNPRITITIDLFSFGLAFVSTKFSKEDFILRF